MSTHFLKPKLTKKYHIKVDNKIFIIWGCLILLLVLGLTKSKAKIQPQVESPLLSYFEHGNRDIKKIALTFDADMTPFMLEQLKTGKVKSFYNKEIVDILRQNHIPATIFITGLWAEKYSQITKELFNDPLFEIANHSYSHPGFTTNCFNLPGVPKWGKDQEFVRSQEAIKNITGIYPKYFRFPGGCSTLEDVDLANKHGLTVVGWDAASNDSFNTNLASIVNNVKVKTQNGSILLFHFNGNKNAPLTAPALLESIHYLQDKGFQFVKLSSLQDK